METQVQIQEAPRVIIKKVVQASRERVFDAWTKPELLEKWLLPPGWTANCSNELRVGGSYRHDMISNGSMDNKHCNTEVQGENGGPAHFLHHGEYLELKRPERLVFTWNSPSVENSRVTVELRDLGGKTEVIVIHELLNTPELVESHTKGWHDCLHNLTLLFPGHE